MFPEDENIDIKSTPPFIDHENGTRIYLSSLAKSSSRFLNDLQHIYEAINLEDNRFFVKAYNKTGMFSMDLPNKFDILTKDSGIRTKRKICDEVRCKVSEAKNLTARELEWVSCRKDKKANFKDDALVIVKHHFVAEVVEEESNPYFDK